MHPDDPRNTGNPAISAKILNRCENMNEGPGLAFSEAGLCPADGHSPDHP
jgi:hypothetical protein